MIMLKKIIGREREQKLIEEYIQSDKPELIAVYGRRRVGKTYLIRKFFDDKFDFYFTGSFETPRRIQLDLFQKSLQRYSGKKLKQPKDWFEAFGQLQDYLSTLKKDRIIVFLDELPWMDTPKSNFLTAFSYFWNSWASTVENLKLFICGSATTWMLSKLIGDKGGMHGRVNRQIYLRPFNLEETEEFLESKKINWTRYQIAEAYMTMGGIPYYLDMLEPSMTVSENIDQLFFSEGAVLKTEYDFVFRSLFKDSTLYRSIVEILAQKSVGMTREEICSAARIRSTGLLTEALDNLCKCDFLRTYHAFGKKTKEQMYQLVDLYSLFYLKFVNNDNSQDEHFWSNMREMQARKTWEGYAFEQLCLHHIPQIKQKLRIGGVLTDVCSWQCKPFTDADGNSYKGTQIDLLIDRRDGIIDVCEMKFSNSNFMINSAYDERLRDRLATFRVLTKTKKALHLVIITTYGLVSNKYSGDIQSTVLLDDLFQNII
jgi:AAA+ ATPase superfamily predicted ATPase